jgi:hypothetical protein
MQGFRYPVATALLPWGDGEALHAALKQVCWKVVGTPATIDIVLLADVIYGGDPGIWKKLVDTLSSITGFGEVQKCSGETFSGETLILQCETKRAEGVLFGIYWDMLHKANYHVTELPVEEEEIEFAGGQVRAWAIRRGKTS